MTMLFRPRTLNRHSWIVATMLSIAGISSHAIGADSTAPSLKGEYFLSRTPFFDPACQPFTRNLNRFRNLEFDQCHPRLSDKFPEFSRPYQWDEIPFDLALAEKAIKSTRIGLGSDDSTKKYNEQVAEERWQQWLKGTDSLRAKGAVQMWRTKVDIDGDGQEETLLRMLPGGRDIVMESPPPLSCDYNLGELYVIESTNPKVAEQFNWHAHGADIIRYADNNHYYVVEWLPWSSSDGRGYALPDIGATRGVILHKLYEKSAHINGPVGVCLIDWVRTGQYRSPNKQDRKARKDATR